MISVLRCQHNCNKLPGQRLSKATWQGGQRCFGRRPGAGSPHRCAGARHSATCLLPLGSTMPPKFDSSFAGNCRGEGGLARESPRETFQWLPACPLTSVLTAQVNESACIRQRRCREMLPCPHPQLPPAALPAAPCPSSCGVAFLLEIAAINPPTKRPASLKLFSSDLLLTGRHPCGRPPCSRPSI